MEEQLKVLDKKIKLMKLILLVLMVLTALMAFIALLLSIFCIREMTVGNASGLTSAELSATLPAGVTKVLLYMIVFSAMLKSYMMLREIQSEKTPFTDLMPRSLKMIGWMLIIAGILPGIAEQVMAYCLRTECGYTSYSFMLILIGAMMLMLEGVFRIGLELRKSADETV